jgi:radical SAM superfamily enzyme YgiQ (UPF0313 family)
VRILLIATNQHHRLMSRMDARPLPIGLAYVAGHLDRIRHSLKVLDLMFSEDPLATVEEAVRDFQPEVVGISIRNLSNHSYLDPQWALPASKEVIQKVRSLSDAAVICGGPAVSLLPKECFDFLEPDLALAGDAGEAFAELVDRLGSGETIQTGLSSLEGLVFRQDGETVFNGARCASSFSVPPRLEDLDMDRYRKAGFGIGIVTKLGDFQYPTVPTSKPDSPGSQGSGPQEDGAWRVIRPIEDVVQEVKEMDERFGLRKVFFIDNGFNVPMAHAKSLCQALIEERSGPNGPNVHWNTCLAPFSCDAEMVRLMKQAGCALVIMGSTKGNANDSSTLEELLEPMAETAALCEEGGLHYTVAQTFGEPGETREIVEAKLAFLRRLKPAVANLRVGVSVMPGTPVAALALEEGLISDESELIKPTFYLAPAVKDWIVDYLKGQAASNPRWNLV